MVQPEEIRREFVKRLKQALAKSEIAEWGAGSRLAEITGKTPKAASKWLNGEAMPGRANMQAIADELHVSIQWLQYGEGEMLPGGAGNKSNVELGPLAPAADNHKEIAAAKVMEMLQKHGNGLSAAVRQRIVDAVADTRSEPEPPANQPSTVIIADFLPPAPAGDAIRIAHYDVRTALGSGQLVPDYPEIMPNLLVSKQHLQELGVIYKDPAHLKMLTGYGQSMAPTIQHLDPMIVDASIREFEGDGIYSFVWQGHFYTKRLQVADAEHFEMISDNPNHKDRLIRIDETYIQARVLLVWNAKKL
ncbi:hypothetical protein ACG10_14585 [Azotobacter chroococcum]|nr:hypothetical protein ACG10_14585 [Azotobacter chroococcum]